MPQSYPQAFTRNFLGNAPTWYKLTILLFLIANPILLNVYGPFITGWVLIGEFIFTLAMALKCYPLPAGGLLALEAVFIGMTKADTVYKETLANFEVILLLIFMVAGIYFMKDFLRFTFTRILVDQFRRCRDGDRFWYQAYLPRGLIRIVEQQTLASIIRRNSGIKTEISDTAFLAPTPGRGH